MRVAERMHVPEGAIDRTRRDLKQPDHLCRNNPARLAELDLRVSSVEDQRRQPADLEISSPFDQRIGLVENPDEAWFCVHEMRVFRALRKADDLHPVSPNLARNRSEIGRT